ncbi:MAG: aminopeptidase P family protein [Thermoflexales bacterium]|nr:aminopeptidase P family protein [Thermoflexales bacterium]
MNNRLNGLRRGLADAGLDAAVLVHPRDVLYYAGTARPATLVVGPQEAVLLVRRGLDLAHREATLERVEPGGGWDTVAAVLAAQGLTGGTLGADLDVMPAQLYRRMRDALPGWEIEDVSPLVLAQRMVKDPEEIRATERAAAVADAGHAALPPILRPGMSELALAAEVEAALRRAGHEGYQPLRYPGARGGGVLLMSGENLTVRGGHGLVITGAGLSPGTPYGPSRREVRPGDLVVLDIGATYDGYTADESRTYVVGRATAAQEALFEAALAVEEAVFSALRPGVPAAEVYAAAEAVAARGVPPHFPPGRLSLPGFVGHGLGLEIDEPPVLWPREETPIAAGMVLAVEVELNAPADGLMAKVEDTLVVETEGPRLLTHAPRRLQACLLSEP